MKLNSLFSITSLTLALSTAYVDQINASEAPTLFKDEALKINSPRLNEDLFQTITADEHLSHILAVKHYRSKVLPLRAELLELTQKGKKSTVTKEMEGVEQRIKELEHIIQCQDQILKESGRSQEDVQKDLLELKETLLGQISEQEKSQSSQNQELSLRTIEAFKTQLKEVEVKLESLNTKKPILESQLQTARSYKEDLDKKYKVLHGDQWAIDQKSKELSKLYSHYATGPNSNLILSAELIKTVIGELGSNIEDKVDPDRIFQLLSRSLELPIAVGAESLNANQKRETYLNHLALIVKSFELRIKEDLWALELAAQILKNVKDTKVELDDKASCTRNLNLLLKNKNLLIPSAADLEKETNTFESLLLSYGYKQGSLKSFFNQLIKQYPYGLLGVYINSLNHPIITSWTESPDILPALYIKDYVKNDTELVHKTFETFQSLSGRLINVAILNKIKERLKDNAPVLNMEEEEEEEAPFYG